MKQFKFKEILDSSHMIIRIFLVLLSIVVLVLSKEAQAIPLTFSAGGTHIYATNLTLNPNITGMNIASGSDILYVFNATVKTTLPINENFDWIANIKGEEFFAYQNQSLNNHSFGTNGGIQFHNDGGFYASLMAKYKFTYYFNKGNQSYKANSLGLNATGIYTINPVNIVASLDYDNVTGWYLVPGSDYTSIVGTLLVGGSPWEGGNIYVGPSFTSITPANSSITSGIVSFSQQFAKLTTNITYVYQSKDISNGHLFVVGANYNF